MERKLSDIYGRLFTAFGPQRWWPGETPFEVAVGAILTQNTNWSNVEKAILNLKSARALNCRKIHEMPVRRLASLIRPAGYFNVKARRLKNFVDFLVSRYGGSMKRMAKTDHARIREELLAVNGIGPETADSIILYALGHPVFVIDAYTKRIFSRHTILKPDASYATIQKLFHENLEQDGKLYNEYHALLVRLAKEHCRTKPHCAGCPLEGV